MKAVFIYALKDPVTGAIRYIGKTNNPATRLRLHLSRCQAEKNHRASWIRSLLIKGLQPLLEIIDEVPEEHWPQLEVAYIEFYRDLDCALVNGNAGGVGGHNPSAETRAKISAFHKGKLVSPETCAKISASKSGEKHPCFGKKLSPETCAKIRTSKLGDKNPFFGRTHTSESGAKMRAARLGEKNHMFGKTVSTETRLKQSVSAKLRGAGDRNGLNGRFH